jgi:hypothetical protein
VITPITQILEKMEKTKARYSEKDIMMFSDGWHITFWSAAQRRIIRSCGPYKTKDEARHDMKILNSK